MNMNDLYSVQELCQYETGCIFSIDHEFFFYEISDEGESFVEWYSLFNQSNRKVHLKNEKRVAISDFMGPTIERPRTLEKIQYLEDFKTIQDTLNRGEIDKVVWFNEYLFESSFEKRSQIIERCINKSDYHLLIFWDQEGLEIVHTPELLLNIEMNHFVTYAIAGTSSDPKELQKPKIKFEHSNVTNNILKKLIDQDLRYHLGEIETIKYGRLFHLFQPIMIMGEYLKAYDLIEILAPTSAVFGNPTEKLFSVIDKLEYYAKEPIYGGPIHICTPQGEKVLINIRSAKIDREKTYIANGCGIVTGSKLSNEIHESELKCESVLSFLYD